MITKVQVTSLVIKQTYIEVIVDDVERLKGKQITPEKRMLADSDHLAFVYIVDVDDEFIYIHFPEKVWNELKVAVKQTLPLIVVIDHETKLELQGIHEELLYYISNIEENSNYGDQMVQTVRRIFSEIF